MKRYAAVLASSVALGTTLAALAQMKPLDAIKYRQSPMFIVSQNFGPLAHEAPVVNGVGRAAKF